MSLDKVPPVGISQIPGNLLKVQKEDDLTGDKTVKLESGVTEPAGIGADQATLISRVRIPVNLVEHGFSMPLSENIHLLGDTLGEVILEHAGEKVFNAVEALRGIAKELRKTPTLDKSREIRNIVQELDINTSINVLRAFTVYFHLVNECEKNEISRVNRERELNATLDKPRKESISEAVYYLKQAGAGEEEIQLLLNKLSIQPVFTAHPTEAKRPEMIAALNTISMLTQKRKSEILTQREHIELEDEIKRQITLLWLTPEIRPVQPTVLEEAENNLYFLNDTLIPLAPELTQDVHHALEIYYPGKGFVVPPILKVGSWVGGDRDGNPNVTPQTTMSVVQMHAMTVIKKYVEEIRKLRDELSISEKPTETLQSLIKEDAAVINADARIIKLYENEPYRMKLYYIEKKLENTLAALNNNAISNKRYKDANEFLQDLQIISESLTQNHSLVLAKVGTLADLITQVQTFGFHLAELDVRQHSDEHEKATSEILLKCKLSAKPYKELSEGERVELLTNILKDNPSISIGKNLSEKTQNILDTFKVIKDSHAKLGKESIRCYVISFTQSVSDVLEVLFLAREAGFTHTSIDVVPLFETVEDLRSSGELLTELFNNEIYKEHLLSRNNFQEIMLGYSDSNKDGGYLSANAELYKAQRLIADVCKSHNVDWRFFHGRGGSIGRGGGQAGKAIQALPCGTVNGHIRLTEQGEVLSARYSQIPIAHRQLESITHAVLLASSRKEKTSPGFEPQWQGLIDKLAEISRIKYRELVYDDPEFWNFYTQVTPVRFISQLKIASRPASRKGLEKIEDLRAIPWVFSWTQTRMMVSSWYGVGSALNEVAKQDNGLECLQNMYKNFPFFKSVIDNCQTAVAKADMHTASQYIGLAEPVELGNRIFKKITDEYDLTRNMLLNVTEQNEILDNAEVIQKSIQLRNPYTDPLNYIQVELLKRLKEGSKSEEITPAVLLSINGIAAAMQETG